MLGRVYWAENKPNQARPLFERAAFLYNKYGMFPDGPNEYLKLAEGATGK